MESKRILVSGQGKTHKRKRHSSRCRTWAHSGGSSEKDVHIFVGKKIAPQDEKCGSHWQPECPKCPQFWSWLWSLISSEHYPDSSHSLLIITTQGYCHSISNLQIRKWKISWLMPCWTIHEDRARRIKTQGTTVYVLVKSTEVTSWQENPQPQERKIPEEEWPLQWMLPWNRWIVHWVWGGRGSWLPIDVSFGPKVLKEERLRWRCSRGTNGGTCRRRERRASVSPLPSLRRCFEWQTQLRLALPRQERLSLILVKKKEIFVAVDLGLIFPPSRIMRMNQNSPVLSALRDNQVCKISVSRWSYFFLA